jgi:hypothetical protein
MRDVPSINGLTGKETNPYNTSDPNSKVEQVNENGFDTGPDDPCHSFDCITEQVYGYKKPVNETATPKMNGFVQVSVERGETPYNPMSDFNSSKLPILYTLAQEFAVFDKWFCSAPTPTNPNRAYVMSGTSAGWTTNDIPSDGWPQQTHFEQLTAAGKSWRIYYSDDPWAALYFHNLRLPENLPYILPIEQFWVDLANNDLADYVFLEPLCQLVPMVQVTGSIQMTLCDKEKLYTNKSMKVSAPRPSGTSWHLSLPTMNMVDFLTMFLPLKMVFPILMASSVRKDLISIVWVFASLLL